MKTECIVTRNGDETYNVKIGDADFFVVGCDVWRHGYRKHSSGRRVRVRMKLIAGKHDIAISKALMSIDMAKEHFVDGVNNTVRFLLR